MFHVYLYFLRDYDNKRGLAKSMTWIVFTVIFGLLLFHSYTFFVIIFCEDEFVQIPYYLYLLNFVFVGYFVYRIINGRLFERLDTYKNYHIKYYIYFFILAAFSLWFSFYTAFNNADRVDSAKKKNANTDFPICETVTFFKQLSTNENLFRDEYH